MPKKKSRRLPQQAKIREYGYRMTPGRKAVMEVLFDRKDHLSAEDIYLEVHAIYPAIGLTSVYRTLQMLVNIGMVFKLDFGDGRARYQVVEGPSAHTHHHHFVCTNCGRIIDHSDFIEEELAFLKKVEEGLAKKYGLRITNHNLQFYGFCDRCANQ